MFCFVILSDAKNLANVSCKVPARDPCDTTFCQDDKTLVLFLKLWTFSPLVVCFKDTKKHEIYKMSSWNSLFHNKFNTFALLYNKLDNNGKSKSNKSSTC